MKTISKHDIELIATVGAHLKQVESATTHDATEASMRVVSGSLRFLLNEGNLASAWHASGIGGPMIFRAWCIDTHDKTDVVALCGGGDIIPGIPISACRGAKLKEKQLGLGEFCRSARIQVDDIKISTVELIDYMANARGGTHFDPSGRAAKKAKGEVLRKIDAGEIVAVPILVNQRNLLHHEILSICQVLVRSPQSVALVNWQAPTAR